jgi:hypothetical protein
MKTTGTLLAIVSLLTLATVARAEALPESSPDSAQLIEQLDAPEFARRQEASRKLTEAGKAAFSALEKAAQAGQREVAIRAIEILKSHFQGGDDDTRQAAKVSLERLAAGASQPAAQRAKDVLNPPPEPLGAGNLGGINPAVIQLMQQQAMRQQALQQQGLRLQFGAAPGQRITRTSVRTINGLREIEVQNGDKVTKVRDVPGGGIEGEITEKVGGKDTTRKVEAKDLDDLKKKDADLARVYEQYQPRPATPDTIKRQLESVERMLERMKADLPNNPNAQRSIDSLERMKQQFQQRLKDAEKPAAAPAPNPFE